MTHPLSVASGSLDRTVGPIIGLGEILWDLLPGGKQLGGAPANFAYFANQLGGDASVVSQVGDDPLGREILSRLDTLSLNRQCIATDAAHPTGTVSVQLDNAGVPTYIIHENVAWDFIQTTPEMTTLAGRAKAVCYGTLAQRAPVSRQAIRSFIQATHPQCLRVLDINLRQRFFSSEILDWSLRHSTVVKLNDEEYPVVAATLGIQANNEDAFAAAIGHAYGVSVIAITRGSRGSVLYAGGRRSEHHGLQVQVVDTVGAGDAFTAALAAGLIRGDELNAINQRANAVAAFVCSQKGATPPMPPTM